MNTVTAQGAPNSPIRFVQNHPAIGWDAINAVSNVVKAFGIDDTLPLGFPHELARQLLDIVRRVEDGMKR